MFKKAERKQVKARIALVGPPGAGKTYTALRVMKHMGCQRLAVLDTERGSASKYIGDPELPAFDVCELETFSPANYVKAIKFAGENGYDGLIIDSASHAWNGDGGALDMVSKQGKGGFEAWNRVTPEVTAFIDAILSFPGHVISTFRTKNEYVENTNDKGKKVREKVGLAPVFKEGVEYEFDVVGYMDSHNILHIDKTRCQDLADQHYKKPGAEFARILKAWCEDGAAFDEAACIAKATACNTLTELKAWADEYRNALKSLTPDTKARVVAAHKTTASRLEEAAKTATSNGSATTQAA